MPICNKCGAEIDDVLALIYEKQEDGTFKHYCKKCPLYLAKKVAQRLEGNVRPTLFCLKAHM
jgi:hypothetical protein